MIREANAQDFERLLELYGQLHPDDPQLSDGTDRAAFDEILAAANLHLFVLEDDAGRVQATCYLNVIPNITRHAAPYAIIENVVTEASERNRGLGQAVIGHALQAAWTRGCYKVMLQTGSRRAATHHFYRSCGFRDDDKFAFVARPP